MEKWAVRALLGVALALSLGCAGVEVASDAWPSLEELYTRCNLKVLAGNKATWVNWQSSPSSIPVATRLQVRREGDGAELRDLATGTVYQLDLGSSHPQALGKFFVKEPPNLSAFTEEVRRNIADQLARVGMTKEEVYIAMGPPVTIRGPEGGFIRTHDSTYEDILRSDAWVYARRKMAKSIGVAFGPNGVVSRTEGIWR